MGETPSHSGVAMDHIETYIRLRVERGELAASSARAIRYSLRNWVAEAGDDPTMWTEADVIRWLDGDLRANSRKMMLHRLRPFVRWMMGNGHMSIDPTINMARIAPPKGAPRDMDPEDISKLVRQLPDQRARVIVLLMLHCALRCSDVARVRIEDIDARRRILNVRAKGGRGEPTHYVPIPDEAWSEINRLCRDLGRTTGPLIESYNQPGVALRGHTISSLLQEWINDAGLKAFPHDGRSAHALRHTCAQDMIDRGADMREVQFGLGHATIRSTEIYLRREPPGLREAMNGRTYLRAA